MRTPRVLTRRYALACEGRLNVAAVHTDEEKEQGAPKSKRRKKKRKYELLDRNRGEQMGMEPLETIQGSQTTVPREQELTQTSIEGFLTSEVGTIGTKGAATTVTTLEP